MRGKTETIKQRALYIYLPSIEMAEEWKRLAEKDKMSISKFIIENVENSLKQRDDYSEEHGYLSKGDLVRQIKELKEENSALRKDNEMLRAAFDKLDGELKRYRMEPFLDEGFKGVRGYEKELVELFKSSEGKVRSDEILYKLGILEVVPGGWIWRG